MGRAAGRAVYAGLGGLLQRPVVKVAAATRILLALAGGKDILERTGGTSSGDLLWRLHPVTTFQIVFAVALAVFTLTAAVWDTRFRQIPNWITVPSFLLAVGLHTLGGGWWGFGQSALGFAVGFGFLFLIWALGAGGAGDVKLMGAVGAWMGLRDTLWVFVVAVVVVALGMVLVLSLQAMLRGLPYVKNRYLARSARFKGKRPTTEEEVRRWQQARRVMPYAVPVCIATWVVLFWHWPGLLG